MITDDFLEKETHMQYYLHTNHGRLAQLVRATALHAVGHRFESYTAHQGIVAKEFGNNYLRITKKVLSSPCRRESTIVP